MPRCNLDREDAMDFYKKLVCHALYAGIKKDEYRLLTGDISKQNRELLKTITVIIGVMLLVLTIVSAFISNMPAGDNTAAYLFATGAVLCIAACVWFPLSNSPSYTTFIMYLFQSAVYAFAFYISLLHKDYPAVTAVVLLFVCPIVFLDRPLNNAIMTTLAVLVFCILTICVKDRSLAMDDVWNMISFGFLSITINNFLMRPKIRVLQQQRRISYMGSHDLMTGLKNRNSYEAETGGLYSLCSRSLTCIFVDVNGLHAINNTKGHKAGDEMLRTVARLLIDTFGEDHGYRTGGDEFVFFLPDADENAVRRQAAGIQAKLQQQSYAIALGIETMDKQAFDLETLVSRAEAIMYKDKGEFYQRPENNRRANRR